MDESQDSAVFAAECVTVGLSRAEVVQQVLSTARATLARSRADNQFRDAEEPLGVPEPRSRGRRATSCAPRDRTLAAPASAPAPQAEVPTWEQERDAVFDAIRGLRELCEALSEGLAELRWRQLGTSFDSPRAAYQEMKKWAHEEHRGSTNLDARSCDDEGKEEPFEIPPLHSLRQT